jgi:HAD superfamily hydrolase (TIGR01509 family)
LESIVKVAAVAWDIDGTLIDSEPRHHRALVEASRYWQVDLADLSDQAFRGIHMRDVWSSLSSRFPLRLTFEEWLAAINDAYITDREGLAAVTGAVETINALASAGIPQICVSNSNRAIVDANIEALGIAPLIVGSISIDDVTAGKPGPEPYLRACELLGCLPQTVIAIEDSITGVRSARQAGLFTVAFSTDETPFAEADVVIRDLRSLLTIVGELRF